VRDFRKCSSNTFLVAVLEKHTLDHAAYSMKSGAHKFTTVKISSQNIYVSLKIGTKKVDLM